MQSTGDVLKLDPEENGVDFDTILRNCNRKDIRHVSISLPQEFVLQEMSVLNRGQSETLKLSPKVLESFLENQKELVSFEVCTGDCCWEEVAKMTNGGKALLPLARAQNLEKLVLVSVVFPDISDLTVLLKALTNLKDLELNHVEIGALNKDPAPWPRPACTELASALSNLKKLVKLEVNDHYFTDEDIRIFLSSEQLSNLRCLSLEGAFGDSAVGGSNLTDAGFATIASECPKLQALNLNFQKRATEEGVRTILERCLHLRELAVSGVPIARSNLFQILSLASKKLLLCRVGNGFDKASLHKAMVATGGRVLLTTEYHGLVEATGLSADCRQAFARSKGLVEEASNKLEDPGVYNEWEDLF